MSTPPLPLVIDLSEEDVAYQKAHMAIINDRYKDRVATCPTEKGWGGINYMYQGFWYRSNSRFSAETTMALQDTFQARPTDIYLATLPKSGTTWIKALAFAIVNRDRYKDTPLSTHPLHQYNPHACVPFLETEVYRKTSSYVDGHSPRLFGTHINYTSLPQSIIDSGCRIVYMCRDPKDVFVSLFHFQNKLRDKSGGAMTLEEAFEIFSKGAMPKGPLWDHVKEYYNASLEQPTKVLFLTFENMKMDAENKVKQLAEFMGCPFTKEEEAEGVVEEIVRLCSFENLSEANKHGFLAEGVPNSAHFREGKVGGWSNLLTTEMSQKLDQISKEKFHGLDISF